MNFQQNSVFADLIHPSYRFSAKASPSTPSEPPATIKKANANRKDPSTTQNENIFASKLYKSPAEILNTNTGHKFLSSLPAIGDVTTVNSDHDTVQIDTSNQFKPIFAGFSMPTNFTHKLCTSVSAHGKSIIDKILLPPYETQLPQNWVKWRPIPVP